MKRFILVLAAMLIGYVASAQYTEKIEPGMKYKELKEYYNYKDYVKEPDQAHSPVGVGIASYLIPGLGEMICGSGWRGAVFMGGWLACHYCCLSSLLELSDAMYYTGIVGAQAIRIISCIDATRVAKVKNMYKRDLKRMYAVDVDLYPSTNYIKTASGIQPVSGLTLAVRF